MRGRCRCAGGGRRQLVTETLCITLIQTNGLHDLGDAGIVFVTVFAGFIDLQRFSDQFLHALAGIQRTGRILEDHLHPGTDGLEFLGIQFCDVGAVVDDLTIGNIIEPQQQAAQRGLAAAGLAHHAQCGTALDLEVHAVHRMELAVCADFEVFFEVL